MSSSHGVLAHQRNAHRKSNAGPTTTLKRRFDHRGCDSRIGDFQQERNNRYAPPQKRPRSQSQSHGRIPLYHGSNMSRVSNYGDVIHSNTSFPFALRSYDSNTNYQKPFANPQLVPLPLPYRKLDDFDSLPEWVPNQSHLTNFVPGVGFNPQPNYPNSVPINHSNIVTQAMPQQPVVTKDLSHSLTLLNNDKEKPNSTHTHEPPLDLSFDSLRRESVIKSLCVRREPVTKSLYSDMPRQCSSCGIRFKCQEDHSNHMDWHVRKNRIAKEANRTSARLSQKPNQSRGWLASSSLWLSAATGGTTEPSFNATQNNTKQEELAQQQQQNIVPADENQTMCALCEEPFENFFSDEADDWMYKDTVYLNESGPIVHVKCMPETRKGPSKSSREAKITAASALVC